MGSNEFKVIIKNPEDKDNPIIVEVVEGVEYWYIEGIDLNEVRLPKDMDLVIWQKLLRVLSKREWTVYRS